MSKDLLTIYCGTRVRKLWSEVRKAYANRGRSNFKSSGWHVRFLMSIRTDGLGRSSWMSRASVSNGCSGEREWVPTSALSLDPIKGLHPSFSSLVLKGWEALLLMTLKQFFSLKEA